MSESDDMPWDDVDRGPRFKSAVEARAYVYGVCAAMLESQYTTHPENVEGWMFGGIVNEFDRRRVTKEIKRLEAQMLKRSAKLRTPR